MKLLFDTHLLLWVAGAPQNLTNQALALVNAVDNTLFFSTASLWEIGIKQRIGRSDFQVNARVLRRELLDNEFNDLPITCQHTLAMDSLPNIHKDPFDRILVAQAMVEGMTLLTCDALVAQYPGPIQLI